LLFFSPFCFSFFEEYSGMGIEQIIPYLFSWIVIEDELYDVAHDHTEEKNLAADYPEKIRHLRRMLDTWWKRRVCDVSPWWPAAAPAASWGTDWSAEGRKQQ
jgi:hypothetical protein